MKRLPYRWGDHVLISRPGVIHNLFVCRICGVMYSKMEIDALKFIPPCNDAARTLTKREKEGG